MALAHGFYFWLNALVDRWGEVGPQVVLNLVIQKAVEKVTQVSARGKVHASEDLPHIKLGAVADLSVKAVHVVARVVGRDDEKAMQVGNEFRAN